jgi:hypothetical protein
MFGLGVSKRSLFVWLALAAIAPGCSGSTTSESSTPSSPTPPPSGPVEPAINIAGNWAGTLETDLGTQAISMTVVQFADCVDGTWISSGQDSRGAISGFAGKASFTGQLSLERGRCSAVGDITGEVGSETLKWTGTALKPISPCADPLPQSIVVTMRRQ